MKVTFWKKAVACFMAVQVARAAVSCGSGPSGEEAGTKENAAEPDLSHFLVAVENEPDTVDFQCTSIHYTVA
ncbi:hypothetical protein ACTQ56_10700 [[Clostridium] aminophilum]|uniref:hypothetical protein n=1 Tax=[Clostridium] aminophilum TaxID=1526 RepID=UPI0026EB7BAE|nr:hypothetical protein [[Clostridium] aminophilum]MDD6195968.1 hypothetical protein [[Clostridium] aminophilum]